MKSAFGEVLETVILTAVIFFLVRAAVQNFKVEGRSMEPTLHTGQYLLINKASYWNIDANAILRFLPGQAEQDQAPSFTYVFGPPTRGDIIVFRYPLDPSRDFIKRVIGLPGDTVEIKDSKVYVNGRALDEPYLTAVPQYDMESQVVPTDNYFVLGDNRNSSSDSHVWGMVPMENIIGKAAVCYWPPGQWGGLSSQPGLASQ
jgi:signal peptidase I